MPFTVLPVPQVILQDHVEVAREETEAITAFLENKVEYMIQKANNRAVGGRDSMLPLIRLRVSFANCDAGMTPYMLCSLGRCM